MLQKIIVTICLGFVLMNADAQIQWPAVTQQTKPWTRWWWEGSAVNKKDLTWNLEQYKAVGLGGVELTPIYGVQGQEKNFIDFLSPQWMDVFSYTLSEANRLNLGVDVANGTGWPPAVVSFPDTWPKVFCKTQNNNKFTSKVCILSPCF